MGDYLKVGTKRAVGFAGWESFSRALNGVDPYFGRDLYFTRMESVTDLFL